MSNSQKCLSFIHESPTPYQAIALMRKRLLEEGYEECRENKEVCFEKGHKYFITRNMTSIIAFKIGHRLQQPSFMIAASHSDCPTFKVKPNGTLADNHYTRLNTEVYGGPIYGPWLDRPLSLAGRLTVRKNNKIVSLPFDYREAFCIIPSLAIHMNREVNNGYKFNPQVDLMPLLANRKDFNLKEDIARKAGVEKDDLLNMDLYLYPHQKGVIWGEEDSFISSHHLDNLECAYTSFIGFLDSEQGQDNINVYACFDNEEVGSLTRQGAASDFLSRTLQRICDSLGCSSYETLGNSMLVSCDNAHASHPNHPEKDDAGNHCYMNEGIVIKTNANQSYTSDALSMSIFTEILKKEGIPYQYYANRSDIRGGSTLGNISNGQVSLLSLDIGLAQLAMHSCMETAGCRDIEFMISAIRAFYNTHIQYDGLSTYSTQEDQ